MADDLILQDADRTKLDGIVQKMTANNENDADIQFVVNDFKQKYGVKKKEVSRPTTQVSSNGTTKTSQSSYNLDLSLPKVNPNPNNKALPGLGQPFKPEIALKSINDERKFINAKTPTQTNFQDYNTVINDGIKGQNKFDNTTQILTSQNVIPQQAKKEFQQLQQKQQVVKDAKKDTRQNILAVIPELADAKNTDEAISTILKSDMKNNLDYWQQFDDEALLGNDENTLNDFLVSNGLKNQDRELYLKEQASSNPKYGYEYEYNKIGSLFKAVKQRADDYDTVLKQKFGDNYMEIAKQGNYDILNDQDFNKFRQLREKQNELSTKANGLINDSRYSEVKSSREKVEKAQQGVDERAKNDKAYKIGDELNYIGNKLAYGAGHVVKMIAELPSLATSIDKGYDWTDKVADWGNRFSDNLIESIPVSTDKKTGVFNKVADVDGYKVFVDESGEPIDVRDKNNFKVPLSVSQSVVEKFSSNPQTYKTRNEMNSGALVDNGLNTMIDMGIMILGTKGAGMVGAGEKLQKLTSMGIAYQQTKRDVFNDAIKKGLDPRNADLLSNIIGVAAGTSSMLNPMEFNIAKGAGLFNLLKTDGLNAAKLALIKDGKLSVKDYAKEFVSGAIKNTIGENIEELGIENTTQAIANNHFNNQISETDMVDGGLDDRLHILDKQGLETFLITAGSSFLMTPIEINSQTQFNQQEAMKMAIENPEDFAKIKELQLKQGQISQQQFDNETKIYNDVSKTYNAVKDDVKEELQPQLLALLTKKSNLSNKISEIKDEVLSKPYKDQLEQVNKGIESISVGKNADKRLVAPIEQSEILAESTAKDGSSTITKVETEIANKINKGQELTPEEKDYYEAKKDSIDKLVTVNKSPIVPINETVEVEKKEIVLPPPTPQVVAPAELDEQQITEQLNEVLNDKTTPTPLVDTEQEQNISERLPSEYQNNQGVQQINGIGQDVSNESEVPQIEQEQEVAPIVNTETKVVTPTATPEILEEIKSKNLTHVRGKNMGENQSLGTFISTEKGNRYETADNKAESVEVDIKNPLVVENDLGLVGKRTEILNNNKDQFTKEDTVDYQELPNGKITLDDLNDAGIKKLAKLTTEKLQADGYDGIYFKESKTQEGELVVFDKEKVKFKEQTPIADETPKLKAKEKQDLVKSLNKEQVKEFIKLKTPQEKESYLINLRDKEQKLKNDKHDRLVSLMREYNSTASNRTTRKQEIRQSMLKLSSDLGYSIKAQEGDKLEVLNNNGKVIRKINIPTDEKPATAQNIEKIKELTHWFNWNGNDLDFHIDAVKLGLTWQNIRTALADINAGKTESTNINRVANAINEYGNMESLPLVRGFGGNYERLDVTGDDLFWAQKVNEATELLSGYEYNEAEREQALKDLSETDEKEFEQYSDLYSKFVNQDGTLNWEEALKYEQANKTTTDESAKGQGSSNDIGDGKNSQQLQKEKRSAAEIKSELKIKEAELKKLEEKQSQLNKQLEQNLKENQLDLLQGAKPQAMFDDKVEQQKIAEKSKSDIENKRKEIAKLNDELDNINQEEIPFQSTDKKFTTISQSKFNQLLDKLKKAFPNVKVELFGKGNMESAKKALEKYGVDIVDMLSVWHGSPHNFDKFSTDKMGTGEGAQAFGWGLYFTDLESIAKGYAEKLAKAKYDAKSFGEENIGIANRAILNIESTGSVDNAIKFLKDLIEKNKNGDTSKTKEILDFIEKNKDKFTVSKNLYKVSLHKGKAPSEYDWLERDSPLSEKQKSKLLSTPEVKQLISDRQKTRDDLSKKFADKGIKKEFKASFKGEDIYKGLSKILGSDKAASLFLLENGIDGIKYPAESIARGATSDNARGFNYVVFDENAIKIEEKIQFLKTKDGTIYGFKTPDGKVFLNSDAINANTPIHEFGHIWQSVFPNEFAKGISLLVQSPQGRELINEIRKNPAYKGKSITEIQAEALVTAIGNKGETIFNSNPTLYNKFKQWLNDLFAKIGDKLGIKNLSPDDKFDMFTKKVVGELLGGKVLDSKVGTEKSTEKTIAFQGKDIKVKEINGGAEVVNGFYSPLEKIINESKQDKMPVKQWIEKFGKGEEAKWTGLTDWLNSQEGSVSKSEIQNYLKDNRIEIVEVVKGGEQKVHFNIKAEKGKSVVYKNGVKDKEFDTYDKADDYVTNYKESEVDATKFSQYQIEGEKENYKEVLVTMPSRVRFADKWAFYKSKGYSKEAFDVLDDAKKQDLFIEFKAEDKRQRESSVADFKSSHFDEPNILVHLRMNTRTDAEGNKVLFLEEVQSDWGQEGKKKGFEISQSEKIKEIEKKLKAAWEKQSNETDFLKRGEIYETEVKPLGFALEEAKNQNRIQKTPTAPFVTDTNAWTKLGLKVALKEAVKQGADKIAWTTGEQQNDRYDLSKQVDWINAEKTNKGDYKIEVGHKDNRPMETQYLKENELEANLGKELATKIINDGGGMYRGLDLKVGGKGMKGFYGSPKEGSLGIVGNVAKSLFKQVPKITNINLQIGGDYYWQIKSENDGTFSIEIKGNKPIENNKFYNFKDRKEASDFGNKKVEDIKNQEFTSTQHSIDITPEMKAMVELGQPLFQFKPDELTKKVQELRDFELTDEEIRDYLLEAGNTKQQIDDALGVKEVEENKDEVKKELSDSKQRVAERIVLGNSTLNAVKEHIVQQGYDKSDYDSKQIFKDVDELINKFGIEKAESFIDKIGDVGLSEPHKVVLQHKIAEYYGNKALSDETLTEEERKDAMFKSAQLFLDLSEQRTDAGRGNAILAQIYLDSDIYFTLPMFENKMNAIGAQLSGAEKIELENLQNEIKELRKENTKLQELAKKEAEQQIVDDITTHLLVDDLIIDSKIKDDLEVKNAKSILAKGFEDIARMLSSIAMAQQVDKVKFKDTILDMTKATMTISKIGVKKALKSVIKAIKNANQNIDEKLLEDAQKHVLSQIKETDTGIKKKNKEGISKDELIELIEQGADTMEKMVEAIRDKYYDGDKSISDKQIRDEITNYGNSIRQSQTQVEEKLSEIKSLMLLQSKLEDAENNIAPKKTGFIRDKDKIAVREKRRELAEAMKKLTVTLSEDDIAGLNERKLTQIANKIEEVQKVLDGYEKIKNKANFDYNDAVKKKQQELDDLMSSQKALLHYAKENLTNLVAKYQDKLDKKQYSKNPTLNKLSITDSEYQKLKNQLEAKKEQLKSERDNFRNNNADYLLENRQKQIDRQIVEIDNLLAGIKVRKTSEQIKAEKDRKAGVINSSTNQTALNKLKENQKVLEAKKEEWERKVIQKEVEIEKAKQTWLQKIGINVQSISRTLTLGFTDIGWLTVQGGYFGRTKPHLFAKALKESFKGKLSEEAFNQWKRDLKSNPFYETMIKAGLRIPSQSLRDDIFEQEFRESGFTKLLGKNEATDIVNKNGRLSVKFLANLRIQVFQKMYNGLTDSQKADKEELEKLADYVNSRSGAGQVIGEDNKRGLNKWWGLLTSARNTSAMLQQTYIGMLYGLYKNYDPKKPLSNQPVLRRQIINDTINQAVLFSGLYISYLVANGLSGDDDEWNVETSPFSTNFLKLKNKEGDRSYFDMGGMTALNVATLRLLTTITNAFGTDIDNYKDFKGEYSKVGMKDFSSKTGLQILSESIFNRTLSLLAPIKNPFTAKSDKDGNYSMYGKTYTPTEFKLKMLMDMFIPMNLPNIYNDITDKDVNALNAIVNTVLNVIGVSNQNQKYDRPEDSTSPQVNSVPVKSTPVSSMPIVPRPVK